VSSAASWVTRPALADPELTVVAAGLGAMLHVKFPDRSAVYTTIGATVGAAQPVQTSVVTEGGPLSALARKLSGGTFFLQRLSTAEQPGDVLLAPKAIGDIATIRMDGTVEYYLARHAYLASTPHLSLAPRVSRLGAGLDASMFNLRVSGRGTLAVTTYGGLFRLVLGPGELYHIHAKYVVCTARRERRCTIADQSRVEPRPPSQALGRLERCRATSAGGTQHQCRSRLSPRPVDASASALAALGAGRSRTSPGVAGACVHAPLMRMGDRW
jgi:uncharacterized protein (AIM24 family)